MINVAMKILLGYFAAMPNKDALGAKPTDRSDWSDAFEAVSRLAAAREATMDGVRRRIGAERRSGARRADEGQRPTWLQALASKASTRINSRAPSQKSKRRPRRCDGRSRRSRLGLPAATRIGMRKKYSSVWILIGSIWISATLVVAGATAGILYVMG